jgi:Rrf2 family protein
MVSRTVEYALRAVVCLARHWPGALSAGRVSAETKVPTSYLSKVLQSLVRAGLITATRGARGGYSLAAAAETISILTVVNAIEPLERITECPLGLAWHAGGLCPMHHHLNCATVRAEESFAQKSVADLVAEGGAWGPLCTKAKGSSDDAAG